MYSLSKLGRQEICKRIGITNDKSIFVENKDAFIDRMELLNIMFNIQPCIDIYKEEMEEFKSEKDYIDFLNNGRKKLISNIEEMCIKEVKMLEAFLKKNNTIKETVNREIEFTTQVNTNYKLRVYFDNPVYESIKYLMIGLIELPKNCKDYIYNITNSKYLAYMNDIDIHDIQNETVKNIINQASLELGLSIFSLISPEYVNTKEVTHIGKAEVSYVCSMNKSVTSINNIHSALINEKRLDLQNINIELYTLDNLANNNEIACKNIIAGGNNKGSYNIINYDTLSLIAYLRKLYGEPMTEYDRYFEYKGNEAKLTNNIEINWC